MSCAHGGALFSAVISENGRLTAEITLSHGFNRIWLRQLRDRQKPSELCACVGLVSLNDNIEETPIFSQRVLVTNLKGFVEPLLKTLKSGYSSSPRASLNEHSVGRATLQWYLGQVRRPVKAGSAYNGGERD